MERQNNQLTFLDNITSYLGGKRTAEFFRKCDKYIPWDQLAEPVKDMYSNNTSKGGASNWPVTMMIKCMMLQKWFNLSDPMLEEMLLDRLSFRRFIGLNMEDKISEVKLIDNFIMLSGMLDQMEKKSSRWKRTRAKVNEMVLVNGTLSCEALDQYYEIHFEANIQDKNYFETMVSLLEAASCRKSNAYLAAS